MSEGRELSSSENSTIVTTVEILVHGSDSTGESVSNSMEERVSVLRSLDSSVDSSVVSSMISSLVSSLEGSTSRCHLNVTRSAMRRRNPPLLNR